MQCITINLRDKSDILNDEDEEYNDSTEPLALP
jgi:hypothetical protein